MSFTGIGFSCSRFEGVRVGGRYLEFGGTLVRGEGFLIGVGVVENCSCC